MKNLRQPTDVAIDNYDAIAEAKLDPRKTRLVTLRPQVLARYTDYALCASALETITDSGFADSDAEMLKHCYEGPTRPLDKMQAQIRASQEAYGQAICAYCGINYPATFDHYLPQEFFPEFVVCDRNLLPCCSECNSNKGVRWRNESRRTVFNFYYDDISLTEKWLSASVNVANGIPMASFSLAKPTGLSNDVFELVKSHYKDLGLLDRYRKRFPAFWSEQRVSFSTRGLARANALAQLLAYSSGLAKQFGCNYWEVSAVEAISGSNECLDLLLSRPE